MSIPLLGFLIALIQLVITSYFFFSLIGKSIALFEVMHNLLYFIAISYI